MLRSTSQMSLILLVLLLAVRLSRISCCHEIDRSLLLMFKEGVVDPANRLSSWSSLHDCCQWRGVTCDANNRVVALDLGSYNHSRLLKGEINLSSLLALEFLEELDLGFNGFESISTPSLNNSVAAVTHANLRANFSSRLSYLSLFSNVHLHIDNFHWLTRLPSLSYLSLRGIHLPSETNLVQSLSSLSLEDLDLQDCNLTTSALSLPNANFSSLSRLDLRHNDFSYGLPNWLFNLSQDLFYLRLKQCNLRGQIPEFSGYRNLGFLDLFNNKLEGSIPDWLGQLDGLDCLDLSNNSLHSSIPSNLLNASSIGFLDISYNDLSGTLPKILGRNKSHHSLIQGRSFPPLPLKFFLSSNKFKGQLPRVTDEIHALDLSYNSFSGPLSSLLCHTETNRYLLKHLDLSNNYLTQELPDCWNNWTALSSIYLGNNQLIGRVPSTMASSLHYQLRALDLQNNGFFGDVPQTFHNFSSLVLLSLEGNNFSGSIQPWLPESVIVLKLRSNQFAGDIPPQLCSLTNLTILDLASNKFSGSIPLCLLNITSFFSEFLQNDLANKLSTRLSGITSTSHEFLKIALHKQGRQIVYQENLNLVRSIDLSANLLSGEIPVQLVKLTKLQFLNLSCNYLTGEVPEKIGEMKYLQSLDLSNNNLHGNIPQSMSDLSFLSVLNLSYNHFSGQIPLGTQLQGFDEWSYTGNPELCGAPLQKNCTRLKTPDNAEQVEGNDEDDSFLKSLYLGMGVGFAVGFWVVCGSLFLNRSWRHTYFRFFDGMVDRIYVFVAIKLRIFRQMGICDNSSNR